MSALMCHKVFVIVVKGKTFSTTTNGVVTKERQLPLCCSLLKWCWCGPTCRLPWTEKTWTFQTHMMPWETCLLREETYDNWNKQTGRQTEQIQICFFSLKLIRQCDESKEMPNTPIQINFYHGRLSEKITEEHQTDSMRVKTLW